VLSVRVAVHPRSRPDVFLKPEKSKEVILKHLTTRPGETVDLGEIHLSPWPRRFPSPGDQTEVIRKWHSKASASSA
jgi:hypothetical protein